MRTHRSTDLSVLRAEVAARLGLADGGQRQRRSSSECRAYLSDAPLARRRRVPALRGELAAALARVPLEVALLRCRYQFSVTAGTLFHSSHLPVWKWFVAVHLMLESPRASRRTSCGGCSAAATRPPGSRRTASAPRCGVTEPSCFATCRGRSGRQAGRRPSPPAPGRPHPRAEHRPRPACAALVAGPHHQLSIKYLPAYIDERRWRSVQPLNPHVFRDTILALLQGEGISYEQLVAAVAGPPAGTDPRRAAAASRPPRARGAAGDASSSASGSPTARGASPRCRRISRRTASTCSGSRCVDHGGGTAVDDFLALGRRPRGRARVARDGGRACSAAGRASTSAIPGWRWRRRARRSARPEHAAEAHRRLVRAALGLVFAEAGLPLHQPRGRLPRRRSPRPPPGSRRGRRPRPVAPHLRPLQRRAPDRRRPRAVGARRATATRCRPAPSPSSRRRPARAGARPRATTRRSSPLELDRLGGALRVGAGTLGCTSRPRGSCGRSRDDPGRARPARPDRRGRDDHPARPSLDCSRASGYEVCGEARDGVEAVELAESLEPDVILMDVKMPRLDGIEAARRILEDRPSRS